MKDINSVVDAIGFLFHDVPRLMRRRFEQSARGTGLTRAQWQVLVSLKKNEGMNQTGLADILDIEPITLSRHLDRLEAAGYITRRPDPADRRAYRLYITGNVADLLHSMRDVRDEIFKDAFAGISPAEIEQLISTLSKIRGNLSGEAEAEGDKACVASAILSPTTAETAGQEESTLS